MLDDGTSRQDVVAQGLGELELRLRAGDVHWRGDLAGKTVLRKRQRFGVCLDRVGQQLQLLVVAAQGEIVSRELRVQAEADAFEQRGIGLGQRRRRLDLVVHTTPEVDLVARLDGQLVVAVVARLVARFGAVCAVVGLAVGGELRVLVPASGTARPRPAAPGCGPAGSWRRRRPVSGWRRRPAVRARRASGRGTPSTICRRGRPSPGCGRCHWPPSLNCAGNGAAGAW